MHLPSSIRCLPRNRQGNVALIFALSVMVLFSAVGLAIDGARAYAISQKVGRALDAAALAGAKLMNETAADDAAVIAAATAAFNANTQDFTAQGVTVSDLLVQPDRSRSEVGITLAINLPTIFGRISGLDQFEFDRRTAAVYKVPQMEIVMALDVTGSMLSTPAGDTQTKLDALKSVANSVVDTLFDNAVNNSNVRIGLVPWGASVNAGTYAAVATGIAGATGCVVERTGGGALSDDPPDGSNFAAPLPATAFAGSCPDAAVRPLAGRLDRTAIKSAVNAFTAVGGTAGHIGMAWGWYLLSPNWSSYYPPGRKPLSYSAGAVKAVILMSDGVFNTAYVGTTDSDESYTAFQSICSNMRANGIAIYTIGFDLTDARAITELETCAGAIENAYLAANASQLGAAFLTIAKKLASIRIAQ